MSYTLGMGITQAILAQRERWFDISPVQINNGLCDSFAEIIAETVPDTEIMWGCELLKTLWSNKIQHLKDWFTHFAPYHCFIVFDDKYYDSECPQGCNYPDDLPYYQRQLKQFFT